MSVRGVYRFSSLVKQNKKAKICFVIYIAGKRKLFFYIYAVIVKQIFYKRSSNYYCRRARGFPPGQSPSPLVGAVPRPTPGSCFSAFFHGPACQCSAQCSACCERLCERLYERRCGSARAPTDRAAAGGRLRGGLLAQLGRQPGAPR